MVSILFLVASAIVRFRKLPHLSFVHFKSENFCIRQYGEVLLLICDFRIKFLYHILCICLKSTHIHQFTALGTE